MIIIIIIISWKKNHIVNKSRPITQSKMHFAAEASIPSKIIPEATACTKFQNLFKNNEAKPIDQIKNLIMR